MSKKNESKMTTPYRGYRPVPKHFYEEPEGKVRTVSEIYEQHRAHSAIMDKHLCDVFLTLGNLDVHVAVSEHDPKRVNDVKSTLDTLREQLFCLEVDIHNYQDMVETHTPVEVQKQFILTPRRKIKYFKRKKSE